MIKSRDVQKVTLTRQQVLSEAAESVRVTEGLDYFWNSLKRRHVVSPTLVEVKELIVENNGLIFRNGRGVESYEASNTTYQSARGFLSRGFDVDVLDGVETRAVDVLPLDVEIPNYLMVIKGRGLVPRCIYLLEHVLAVHDVTVLQPLFKVVAEYRVRGRRVRQLFVVGRDRHTGEPFALGVPNGFVNQSIDVCLRWTMNLHVGDVVSEV